MLDEPTAAMYTDRWGKKHLALVTERFPSSRDIMHPTVNVVYITDNTKQRDQYGTQKKRGLNVPHRSNQSGPGHYWESVTVRVVEGR